MEYLPAYLFKKLGRHIAISTATGDFYDLNPITYAALEQWNKELSGLGKAPSAPIGQDFARKHNIPQKIIKLFPLPQNRTIGKDDISAATCITDLTLNLTSQCNLQCRYCWNEQGKYSDAQFQRRQRTHLDKNKNIKEMSVETACKAVDILVSNCGKDRNLVVDFYGGEPLLNLETLMATVNYCRKNESKWKVGFHFLVATNGTLLTNSVAGELINNGVQIAISIDGPKRVHDNNRPFRNKKGSFKVIRSNLKSLPQETLKRLVGRVTVTPYYADMVKLYKDLRNLGFERIELFESEDACHRISRQRKAVFFHTEEQYKTLCRQYERLALLYIDEVAKGVLDYRKTFFNRFFKLMQRLYYNYEVIGGCPAAKGQLAVSAQGEIYPCTAFLGVKRFAIGEVTTGINKKKYAKFIGKINKRFDYCRSCKLFSLCRTTGSCLNMNYYFNGDCAVPYERSCDLFREKLELAAASLAILKEKIPNRLEELFGFDPVGKRGNELY